MMAFPFLTMLTVYTYIFYIYVYQTGTVMFKKRKKGKKFNRSSHGFRRPQ